MDWHSRRISAILEHALLEDRATSDATSRACIDPQQRATATILAKQDCILSGVGAIARKTAPGLRALDKYAVRCGGGQNHRLDLSDGILLKNNHIALAGGVAAALEKALRNRHEEQPIEIEVRNLAEMEEALANGAESILLVNMKVEDVRAAVVRVHGHSRHVPVEASGGIRLENVRDYAETGVDYISVGALTHSPQAVDLSMRIVPA
jgi:nicotinate-nucleotide pyrophosphorylase (carboxylating)